MPTPYVTVRSTLTGEFMADYAVFTVVFTAHAMTRGGAVRQVNKRVKDVTVQLKEARGIVNVSFADVNAQEGQEYDPAADTLVSTGYDASIIGLVQLVSPVAATIAHVLTDGGGRILYATWVLSDEADAHRKVRVATVNQARAAAEDYALAAGMQLGNLRSIVDTGPSPLGPPPLLRMNVAPPPTPFGLIPQEEIDLAPTPVAITVTIDVSYELGVALSEDPPAGTVAT